MKPLSRFNQLFSALALTVASTTLHAQNTELNIERSVKVEFNSQKGYSYNVYGTSDPAKKTGWKLLGGEEGTGENIVFFYRSEADQKVFFRIESEPSEGGQDPTPPQPEASVIPITGLPPAESSGTYNLGEAIGETEVGGVYRIGISAGTDGVVIELPHPGLQEYRQKQIKLSIYRGGTGLGSGKVSLKVPTLAGGEYESRKLVDNGAKQLTGEVVILPATASNDGRKVIVELFNDTANTDGAAGGQWVVTTAAEAMKSTLAHRWEGTSLALQKSDGTWEDWVNLQGSQGIRGPEGPQGSSGPQGIAGPEGSQGLLGPKADRGPAGPQGSRGQKGERGLLGYKGDKGAKGDKGNPGVKGDRGNKGEKGDTGNVTANGGVVSCCGGELEGRFELLNQANISYRTYNLPEDSLLNVKDFTPHNLTCTWSCTPFDLHIHSEWYSSKERAYYHVYAWHDVESIKTPQRFVYTITRLPNNYPHPSSKEDLQTIGRVTTELSFTSMSDNYLIAVEKLQEMYVDNNHLRGKYGYFTMPKTHYLWDMRTNDFTSMIIDDPQLNNNLNPWCNHCEGLFQKINNYFPTHKFLENNTFDVYVYTIK